MSTPSTRRVAVIGSGVAGLTAAYVLSRHASVTLYEADARLGGHAHTHHVHRLGRRSDVDTGFIVHNDRTYPTLLRLFAELGVATQDSDMSMSIRSDASGLEYAGAKGVRGLFPTARTLARPRIGGCSARSPGSTVVPVPCSPPRDSTRPSGGTAGRVPEPQRFHRVLRREFHDSARRGGVVVRSPTAADYPARYLFTFLEHHGMLTVFGSPTWRTVTGGSPATSRRWRRTSTRYFSAPPCSGWNGTQDGGACVVDGSGDVRYFDAVVVAVHPRQALALLGDASDLEIEILGDMPYSVNHAQLHTDESLLPRAENARASWNYLTPADSTTRRASSSPTT